MDTDEDKEKLKLDENLAAVRFSTQEDEDTTGMAVVIPAGEIIQLDRAASLLGRMRQVEWKGATYVFAEDLLNRANESPSHRQENPGIVPINSPSR
jgi:hypothetical protein